MHCFDEEERKLDLPRYRGSTSAAKGDPAWLTSDYEDGSGRQPVALVLQPAG
jgi:hypothetical protein